MRAGYTLLVLAAVSVFVAGCSSEAIGERLTEEIAEQAGGGDVDIDVDSDSGEFSIESSEGSMQFGGSDVPESFPDDLPLPETEYSVASSFEQQGADKDLELQVAVMTTAAFDDVAGFFESALPDAGWEITDQQRTQMGELQSVSFTVEKSGVGALVSVTAMEEGETLVNYGIGAAS